MKTLATGWMGAITATSSSPISSSSNSSTIFWPSSELASSSPSLVRMKMTVLPRESAATLRSTLCRFASPKSCVSSSTLMVTRPQALRGAQEGPGSPKKTALRTSFSAGLTSAFRCHRGPRSPESAAPPPQVPGSPLSAHMYSPLAMEDPPIEQAWSSRKLAIHISGSARYTLGGMLGSPASEAAVMPRLTPVDAHGFVLSSASCWVSPVVAGLMSARYPSPR
mmetsp:Transcript_10581/g.29513  ORF Transcript_10581/g.29513 Transcript_10581/m.29513 type:complete len:223 (+) Transcript_10581:149-817(+)